MKNTILKTLSMALALTVGAISALAEYSPITFNGSGYDINLYETVDGTPNGNFSAVGPELQYPETLAPGYLILLDSGAPNDPTAYMDRENWSDVVQFRFKSVQLLSKNGQGVPEGFPTVETVLGGSHTFISELSSVPTPYSVAWTENGMDRINNYFVYSDAAAVPEPSQIVLGTVVLLGAAGYSYRHRKLSSQT